MILLRTRLAKWFHFTRPSLSSISSKERLEEILHQRLLRSVSNINKQTLKQNSLIDHIKAKLSIETNQATQVSQRSIPFTIITPKNHKSRTFDLRLDKGVKSFKITPEQFGLPFSKFSNISHFSLKRGAPVFQQLKQYKIKNDQLLIFNLPEMISEKDLHKLLKEKIKKVTFKYCVLGLPAYAKVEFQNQESLMKALSKLNNKTINFGQRSAKVIDNSDLDRQNLSNRRLVVHIEPDTDISKTIVQMSRFGRVMHIDWPLEASMNPTVEEVKQFYKKGFQLIQINKKYPDGSVETEYYPDIETWSRDEDEREQHNILERAQRLKEAYENRCRFARPVDVWVGREADLSLVNRGYCVVTFSTIEQAQNYYFGHGARNRVELVGERLDFEFDPKFRRDLLREVDNQYLLGVKNNFAMKSEEQKRYKQLYGLSMDENQINRIDDIDTNYRSYYILNRINVKMQLEENWTTIPDPEDHHDYQEQNPFLEWADRQNYFKTLNSIKQSKSFDQLAQIQLFGRVLPKENTVQKLKIQPTKYQVSKQKQLIEKYALLTHPREVKARNKQYDRKRERNNRLARKEQNQEEIQQQLEGEEQIEVENDQGYEDGDNINKHHFSTYRPPQLYRPFTKAEIENYPRRLGEFVRSNIYQYLGVFHDKLIQEAVNDTVTLLNPQSLKLMDGSSFLTDNQLTNALQFRRDLAQAQIDFEDYVYGNEYFKSSEIDLKSFFGNFKQHESEVMISLTDVGLVEDSKKVQGREDEIEEKVNILNNEAASFGEQYKQEILDENTYLVKVKKLEHLLPLDRIAHLQSVAQSFDDEISIQEAKVFEKHYQLMKKKGIIPEEVMQVFKLENNCVAQMMRQMGLKYDISNKDLAMLERIRKYDTEQLKDDLRKQQKMQKYRRRKRKVGSYDFSKDPSQIFVKDRQGYYKVSRYRQI